MEFEFGGRPFLETWLKNAQNLILELNLWGGESVPPPPVGRYQIQVAFVIRRQTSTHSLKSLLLHMDFLFWIPKYKFFTVKAGCPANINFHKCLYHYR